ATALQAGIAAPPTDHRVETVAERIRQNMRAVYAVPNVEITGTHMVDLLTVVTGRDTVLGQNDKERRVNGAQQGLNVQMGYDRAAESVWRGVHDVSAADPGFAATWRAHFGAARDGEPYALDPTASVATLKALPVLRDAVDVDHLVARAKSGK